MEVENLQLSNINYRMVFHTAPVLVLLLKPNAPHFTIIDASNAYLKATMTTREEIIDRHLFDIFKDNPLDLNASGENNLRASLVRVVENKQPDIMAVQKYDIQITTKKGVVFEEKYWNPKNTPVFDQHNNIIYIIHQVDDVTGLIQLETKKRADAFEIEQKSILIKENETRINAILNALLNYTTMNFSGRLAITDKGDELDAIIVGLNSLIDELENQINLLSNSNAELEYANKELDSFSYSVSHDLRAPLRAINGYSQMLIEDYGDKLDKVGLQTINVIIKNAHKMGTLIDDLLKFSRIGKQDLSTITLNMNNLVANVVQEFTSLKYNRPLEFAIKALNNAQGDNNMLKLVMSNLISNAIKYSCKKEKSIIEIGSYIEKEFVVFYVKDNGAGFDMKYYNKLFGVFQRLHSAAEFDGTGVGLALVQRIIKKHHGEIWAEAIVDEGATFYFSLPIINS